MPMNRRQFLMMAGVGGGALLLPRRLWGYAQSPATLRKFVQALPGLGSTGIPVAQPNRTRFPGSDYYEIELGEFQQSFHPDLPPSRLWGYADVTDGKTPNHRYLGGVISAHRGRPVRLVTINRLPPRHPLPVDTSLMEGDPGRAAHNRAVVHLHGGFTPWTSDGVPHAWVAPGGAHGPSFLNPGPYRGSAEHYYPNDQSARMMFYHDHALDLTRLNVYAGLASAYVLRDDLEEALIQARVLPSREVPLVIQDKIFFDGRDPGYVFGRRGDLWYPYQYEASSDDGACMDSPTGRWPYGPCESPPASVTGPLPVPSVVPEFFGDTSVVNGAAYPYLEVERRRYRFRILNAAQARFLNLKLYYADASGTEVDLTRPGPAFVQIGTEGGFLPWPVLLSRPLLLGSAERADLIVDFSDVPAGARLILYNDAPAPFPMGDPRNDYFTGAPDLSAVGGAPPPRPGFGPNTRTLMQLRVLPRNGPADPPTLGLLERVARGQEPPALCPLPAQQLAPEAPALVQRHLTLNEDFDERGRLVQRLGTNQQNGTSSQGLPTWGRPFLSAPTETPRAGAAEVWHIANLTGDVHPIHFHLVNVRVLARRPFDVGAYDGTTRFTGPPRGPAPNELGGKETVRMNPGEVTSVFMRFDLPRVPFPVPLSPRTGGHEYVWHCHILEHEEHDMMRPLVVRP